jgi:monofunctional biosynthetic peptidoglycan transglycosylase
VEQERLPLRGDDAEPRTAVQRVVRALGLCVAVFVLLSIFLVTLYRDVSPPATPLMLLRLAEGYGIAKSWRDVDEISPLLVETVIAGEDETFCSHRGFDWNAVAHAWRRYQRGGGRLLGASTISMQTAKNLFLWPGRDWLRKGLEAYFTGLIELAWSKQRIIEIYLNIAEWGPGIYGAEAAAEHYFDKSADRLSPDEAVRLAVLLPDPLAANDLDRPARRAFILRHLPELPVARPLPCGEAIE